MKATVLIKHGERWLEEVNPFPKYKANRDVLGNAIIADGYKEFEKTKKPILTSDLSLKEGDVVDMDDYDIMWQYYNPLVNAWFKCTDESDARFTNVQPKKRQIAHRKPAQHPVEGEQGKEDSKAEWDDLVSAAFEQPQQAETKTAETILKEHSKVIENADGFVQTIAIVDAMREYGRLCVEADRKDAAGKAKCKMEQEISTGEWWPIAEVDKESILNRPIILPRLRIL